MRNDPIRGPRFANVRQHRAPTPAPEAKNRQADTSSDQAADPEWTPTRTASLLKAVLYVGVGVGTWRLLRSSAESVEPEPEAGVPDVADYSMWEPEE